MFPHLLSRYKTQEQKVMKQVLKLIYCIILMKEIILYHVTTSCINLLLFPLHKLVHLNVKNYVSKYIYIYVITITLFSF